MHFTFTRLAASLLVFSNCETAWPQWTLERVADSNTPVPGGGAFIGLGERPFDRPSLGPDGRIAFWARYNDGANNGVFSNATGNLETVANLNTIIPGTSQAFTTLSPNVTYDTVRPTFSGSASGAGGVYYRQNGQLHTIVDRQTPLPGKGAFGGTYVLSRSGDRVAFGRSATSEMYQSNAGAISLIAGLATLAPGGGTFTAFAESMLSGSSIAFQAAAGARQGVFLGNLAGEPTFSVVADTTTPIPNGTGNFRTLGYPSLSQDNVAFIGSDQQLRSGVYARINGQLLNIADTIHPGPGGIQFTGFDRVAISGDSIAFVAGITTAPFGGLFVLRNGALSRVVAVGDTLNGLVVSGIHFGPEGLKGDTIAFSFSEAIVGPFPLKGGVYTATYIPGPGVMGISAAAALAAARRQR